jgi:hypothetical protein
MQSSQSTPSNTILITNPLPFMTKPYLTSKLLSCNIITKTDIPQLSITSSTINEIPIKTWITFPSDASASKFFTQFNNKSFEKSLDQ